MSGIKGPAVFLAQFLRDVEPFHELGGLAGWLAGLGYKGVQIPTWDARVIDLDQAAASRAYCDDYCGRLAALGLEPTELAGHLQGQVLAVHPAYERMFEAFHPPACAAARALPGPPSSSAR
jgi:sugar phosphate isomerase/epimerase